MISHDPRWSLPRGSTLVPSRWQATGSYDLLRSGIARFAVVERTTGNLPMLAARQWHDA